MFKMVMMWSDGSFNVTWFDDFELAWHDANHMMQTCANLTKVEIWEEDLLMAFESVASAFGAN